MTRPKTTTRKATKPRAARKVSVDEHKVFAVGVDAAPTPRSNLLLDWQLVVPPPLDEALTRGQAIGGLQRLSSWILWALEELRNDDGALKPLDEPAPRYLGEVIARMNALSDNYRADESGNAADRRNMVVHFAITCAESVNDNSMACAMINGFARDRVPTLAAVLEENESRLSAALDAWRAGTRQKAVLGIEALLGMESTSKAARNDALKRYTRWLKARQKRWGGKRKSFRVDS